MTENQANVQSRDKLTLTTLAKYVVKAWLMSFRSEEIVTVSFTTANGSSITFIEFLKGRKLP